VRGSHTRVNGLFWILGICKFEKKHTGQLMDGMKRSVLRVKQQREQASDVVAITSVGPLEISTYKEFLMSFLFLRRPR
jgi:hypothetical protein